MTGLLDLRWATKIKMLLALGKYRISTANCNMPLGICFVINIDYKA
jgi:hypothetical protein